MATIDIRRALIDEILRVEDKKFLEGILALVKLRASHTFTPTYQLTKEQADALDFSMNAMDEGKFVTSEEANAEIEKWLEK